MKKLITLLCGVLVLCCLLTACTGTGTPAATTGGTPTITIDPQAILGTWYAERGMAVIDLRADNTMDYYYIQPGYYNYYGKSQATYTVSDTTLTFTVDDTPVTLTWDGSTSTFTDAESSVYSRIDVLPEEHPVYAFPDFSKIDCASAITLGSYKGLTPGDNLKQDAIARLCKEYYEANTTKKPPVLSEDRAAAYGDAVTIDYVGKLNGVEFAGGKANDQLLYIFDGSGYIPGFVEGVIGHKAGETFDVNVTFPENYGEASLAGQAVVFTMTLDSIHNTALTDAEVVEYTKEDSTPYTTYVEMLKAYTNALVQNDLWNQVIKATKYEQLPEECYQYFHQYYSDLYRSYAFYYNMDYAAFLTMYVGVTEQQLLEESKTASLPYVISAAIFKLENLSWTQEKYDENLALFVADAMEYFKYTEEEAREYVLTQETGNFNATLVYNTVTDWLVENNK